VSEPICKGIDIVIVNHPSWGKLHDHWKVSINFEMERIILEVLRKSFNLSLSIMKRNYSTKTNKSKQKNYKISTKKKKEKNCRRIMKLC